MKKELTWVEKVTRKFNRDKFLVLLYFLVPFVLSFLFGFISGPFSTYKDDNGTTMIKSNNIVCALLCVVCMILTVVGFIYSFKALIHMRVDKATYEGHIVLSYVLNKKCALYIDGKEVEKVRRLNYKDFVLLNGITDDGIEVTCKISGINSFFSYRDTQKEAKTVVINQFKKTKHKDKDDLTPIQKKLLEQAKTDALASIDASKPDEAKKKIDLYNTLDELDD